METVTANVAGRVRHVTENGRAYLVADISLIVPGVLAGSKGALYYPPEETARNARAWDGTPIVVYHPTGPQGEHLSASAPGVQNIGDLRNTTFKDKLRTQGWFDVEHTRSVDPRVLDALEQGRPMEISTGLYTTNDPAPAGATHNGRPYEWVARDYRPDHLAILPDQVGACSLHDGCGLNVNTQGAAVSLLERLMGWLLTNAGLNQPRHATGQYLPHGAGTGKGPVHEAAKAGHAGEQPKPEEDDPDRSPGALMDAEATYNRDWPQEKRDKLDPDDFAGPDQSYPITRQADVDSAAKLVGKASDPDAVKKRIIAIATRKGLTVPDAWQEPTENAMTMSMPASSEAQQCSKQAAAGSVMTEHPKAREHALTAMDASSAGNSPEAAASHVKAAKVHEGQATAARKDGNAMQADQHDQAAALHRKAASMHAATTNQEPSVATVITNKEFSSDEERKAAFAAMAESGSTASTKAAKASDSAKKEGSAASHKEAARAHDNARLAHQSKGNDKMAEAHGKAAAEHHAAAEKAGKLKGGTNNMSRGQMLNRLTQNCTCDKDKTTLNSLSDDTLKALVANAKDDDEDETDREKQEEEFDGGAEERFEKKSGTKERNSTGQPTKRPTVNEWLDAAPPEVQSAVRNSMEIERREKHALVTKLVQNVSDNDRRQQIGKSLMAKPLAELRDLVSLMQPARNEEAPAFNFQGAAGGGQHSGLTDNEQADVLDLDSVRNTILYPERKQA